MTAEPAASTTDAAGLRALRLVREGRLVDLTRVISRETPRGPQIRPPVRFLASGLPVAERGVTIVNDYVTLCTHFGTHIDTPGHIAYDGEFSNGGGEQEVSLRGLVRLGAETMVPRLVTARILDLSDEQSWPLTAAAVEERVTSLGGVETGDALLVRLGEAQPPDGTFDADAVEWLATRGLAVLGSDHNIDDPGLALHVRCVARGEVTLLEGLALERLSDDRPFALFLGPIRVARASGAWVSAVAIL